MATRINYTSNTEYVGLSTEAKPKSVTNGTTFKELDTNITYTYYGGVWYPNRKPQDGDKGEY